MSDFSDFELADEVLEEHDAGIWLSIGDLMSGLLMFFALLFITVMVQLKQYQEAFDKLPLVILNTLRQEVPGGENLQVDQKTGDVSIPDAILFDEGSAELKPAGKQFLRSFIPVYSKVIFSNDEFDRMITRVIVEGHTSSFGTERENMDLSLQRALSVSEYISSLQFPTQADFKQKVLAAGRGELDANQQVDSPRDRKVVFRFQLRPQDWGKLFEFESSLPEE
ncbi:OmpA/MotB family protein [Phormidium sp. CCY1219]|uniref:OmpA/MotB family protein n=1 Tax=Phormidium sp. CCY1219 TaxID=2886104 RepID=UPI002D1EB2C4|nr:OmpA family protein [Phormidium sp. CCY1219]MEB3828081.1 OmpA family protein [Phormidium sp. CCY1219]